MNHLSVSTNYSMHILEKLCEDNRRKYPLAYLYEGSSRISGFSLSEYLLNYCIEEGVSFKNPEGWIYELIYTQTLLRPLPYRTETSWEDVDGFFGLPRGVQEGFLIYILEDLVMRASGDPIEDFEENAWVMSDDVLQFLVYQSEEIKKIKAPTKQDEAAEEIYSSVREDVSYNYHAGSRVFNGYNFIKSPLEVIFLSQLIAKMGGEAYIHSRESDWVTIFPASDLIEFVTVDGETIKRFEALSRSRRSDGNDAIIMVNGAQKLLTRKTEWMIDLERLFNHSPWQHDLESLMDTFNGYFPERNRSIHIGAYAAIGG